MGPNQKSLGLMGAKDISKEIMIQHGVPVVPGFQGEDQSEDLLFSQVESAI